eukprot:TRINITY_DN30975_c0_g1_i1.p1 TRINITY_DN30975_c0_g1~~TRINITY_DN30975_c0_g1_i1.p1  ORF type:complete len:938 (+),score=144.51 TRINITY_DN30975_c0_g1_i1:77-2890(+)
MSRCPEFRRPTSPNAHMLADDLVWFDRGNTPTTGVLEDVVVLASPMVCADPCAVQTEAVFEISASKEKLREFEANVTIVPAPADEKETVSEVEIDTVMEKRRAAVVVFAVAAAWTIVFASCQYGRAQAVARNCEGLVGKAPRLCEECGRGTKLLPLFGDYERTWPLGLRIVLYFIGLLWTFLGIGVVCDQFMAAIEEITSREVEVWVEVRPGVKRMFVTPVWNSTVANLTLMALGSSAPEILLNVLEICLGGFFAGELGPSTIVGSAAFNLLVIIGVCISSLPPGEIRKVEGSVVFALTASLSIFAYAWLVLILQIVSPNRVEVGEAVLTLLFFPALVGLAYLADKKRACFGIGPQDVIDTTSILKRFGEDISASSLEHFVQKEVTDSKAIVPTRADIRKVFFNSMIGGSSACSRTSRDQGAVEIGFLQRMWSVYECDGNVTLKVVADRIPGAVVSMQYGTMDGSAKDGVRYKKVHGEIIFAPFQLEATIHVPIIDNDIIDSDEEFSVGLWDIRVHHGGSIRSRSYGCHAKIGCDIATVMVINDDMPGTLDFDTEMVHVLTDQRASIGVMRTRGELGTVSCSYKTVDDTAIAGRDYDSSEGVVTFEHGVSHKTFDIYIRPQREDASVVADLDGTEARFMVVLFDVTGGAVFDKSTNGGCSQAICSVIIPAVGNGRRRRSWRQRFEVVEEWLVSFMEQFESAFYCNGSAVEQAEASLTDWLFHAVSMLWKVLFAFVPPATICGGWLCFWIALLMIGLVTAFVGDMASLLGCCLGIPDEITAITLVALGTSLPDTFASKVAAQQNPTADDAVGNVTGSNCVNVFLGLGLPWTIGSIYWSCTGRTPEWNQHLSNGRSFDSLFGEKYPTGGFMVPSSGLALSVSVFTCCAAICLMLLWLRRYKYGGELGGEKHICRRDSGILGFLWCVYVTASIIISLTQE